ncbi:BMC domain-containing protein [Sedimentibacter sp. zth1]|uniref:BMC domain-containing protein n=1 Tax=Sedimentibacter sp. zth1 TaxID=2816908 RepID=UPI001A91864D|nr:BMC domain-containing protein [Sedimentibacter sp. zth1]QSX05624.1 BMC domain-containing protein [Sedimentibacter sp. zth1]
MQTLGFIETRGLIATIEAADVMTKSADIKLVEKSHIGGGFVTVIITGDVGAVKTAVDAGVAAVNRLGESLLISYHVIPRPHDDIKNIIKENKIVISDEMKISLNTDIAEMSKQTEIIENKELTENTRIDEAAEDENIDLDNNVQKNKFENISKDEIDRLVEEKGFEYVSAILNNVSVVKLRKLAREYKDFEITGRVISKASKKTLMTKFRTYYKNKLK